MPPKSSASRSSDRKYWLWFLAAFLILLPAVTTRIYASDEVEYFVYLRSLWFDQDVSFDNDYRFIYDSGMARPPGYQETFLQLTTVTGKRINFGTVGCAILWAPFYGVADVVAHLERAAGRPVAVDGYSKPYVTAVAYASALYGALSLALSVLICRRVFSPPALPAPPALRAPPFVAAALAWVGTPLVFYMYVTPPMAHATSSFTVALFVLAWLHARDRWRVRHVALLAALGALMFMVREQDLLLAIGPLLDYARALVRRHEGAWNHILVKLVLAPVVFAAVFLPQALAYLSLNGRIGPSQFVTRKMIWSAPHGLQVLFSPEHGFFWWTPLAVIAIAGLVAMTVGRVGQVGWLGFCFLAMVALQVYVNGSVDSWTLAGAFGQRRFVSLTPLLTVGLCAVLMAGRPKGLRDERASAAQTFRAAAVSVVIALCVWWNIALMVQFGSGLMDRQKLELATNVRQAFVTVPVSIPRLAYRYVFDRSSFFKP